jgi:hypothetical protein
LPLDKFYFFLLTSHHSLTLSVPPHHLTTSPPPPHHHHPIFSVLTTPAPPLSSVFHGRCRLPHSTLLMCILFTDKSLLYLDTFATFHLLFHHSLLCVHRFPVMKAPTYRIGMVCLCVLWYTHHQPETNPIQSTHSCIALSTSVGDSSSCTHHLSSNNNTIIISRSRR